MNNFMYKNHRGLTKLREVEITSLVFIRRNIPEYGYQPGWFINGIDYTKREDRVDHPVRTFSLHNIILPESSTDFIIDIRRTYGSVIA